MNYPVIRIMADYSAPPLWSFTCPLTDEEIKNLNLSENLLNALQEWSAEYETNDSYLGDDAKNDFDAVAFDAKGLELAKRTKQELGPNYQVLFFSETKMDYDIII